MMLKDSQPLLFAVFLVFACNVLDSAVGQTTAPKKATAKSMVKLMDRDGDGTIGKAEAPPELKEHFDTIDVNGDGAIDVEEAKVIADYANQQQSDKVTPAAGEPVEMTADFLIATLDKNGDGKISEKESVGSLKSSFGFIDSNKDGQVDKGEAKAALDYAKQNGIEVTLDGGLTDSGPVGKSKKSTAGPTPIALLDKDGDGKISKAEAPEDLVLFFANYDVDGDGMIDKKESAALLKYLRVEDEEREPATKSASVSDATMATAESVMKLMDQNGDSRISKEEAPSQLQESFAYVDVNKDGVIDLKEAKSIADFINQQGK